MIRRTTIIIKLHEVARVTNTSSRGRVRSVIQIFSNADGGESALNVITVMKKYVKDPRRVTDNNNSSVNIFQLTSAEPSLDSVYLAWVKLD